MKFDPTLGQDQRERGWGGGDVRRRLPDRDSRAATPGQEGAKYGTHKTVTASEYGTHKTVKVVGFQVQVLKVFPLRSEGGSQILYEMCFNLKLSGNEVYYTA